MTGDFSSSVSSESARFSDLDRGLGTTPKVVVGAWASGIGLLAGAVSVLGSWIPSVWSDEAAAISAATRPWGELGGLLSRVDVVHGAYYSLMHVWFSLFGVSQLTLRLPSAFAGAVAASGVVLLCGRLSTLRAAICAGVIFSTLPRVTWMGTEGRSSAVATAAAVWLSILFVVALRRSGRVSWIWYGLAAAAAISIWIYLALLVVAHGITVAWSSGSRRHDLSAWALASLGGLVLVSPVILLAEHQVGQVSWLQRPGLGTAKSVVVDQWFGTDGLRSLPLALVCWIFIGIGLARVLRKRASVGSKPSLLKVAFPWLLVPTIGLIAYSLALTPIYLPKYVAFSAPAVAMIVGETVAAITTVWMRKAALLGLVVLAVPSYISARTLTAKDGSDWASVASIIEQYKEPGDAVVYGDLYNAAGVVRSPSRAISVSYPSALSDLLDVTRGERAGPSDRLWDASVPLAEAVDQMVPVNRVWLISDHALEPAGGPSSDLTALTQAGFAMVDNWPGSKTDVALLARAPRG